ncbi:MAG TPA: hypothetical protein PKX23_08225 [Verrucomicrobiota bacterium]|jgi:hypothetical protein|nr:hypothetical protein [Acidobacteriota bacterium]HPC60628.1 hypothetical protein [Verrucomicrobiota bacterium]HRT07443.1 hypothetical protein [Candidatus Paceibacterota bacterium]HRT58228.1 hypothetical protein [Candidatus Paceibacterota bacterium]
MKTGFAEPEIVTRAGPAVSATMPSEDCEALLGRSEASREMPCLESAALSLKPELWNVELRAGVWGE